MPFPSPSNSRLPPLRPIFGWFAKGKRCRPKGSGKDVEVLGSQTPLGTRGWMLAAPGQEQSLAWAGRARGSAATKPEVVTWPQGFHEVLLHV